MHVFVSLLSAGSGGAINYARYLPPLLSSELNARGDRLTVLAYEGLLDSNSFGRGGNNKLIEIPHRSGPARLVWEYLHMDSLLSKLAPDIVFYPHQVSPRIKQIPSVLMIRNMEPFAFQEYPSPIKKKLRNLALREATKQSCSRASHVVCVSQYVRDYAVNSLGIGVSKTTLIYHGLDRRFSPAVTTSDFIRLSELGLKNTDYLLTCGSLLPYRRCEDIVRSFVQQIAPQFPNLKLVVAGAVLDSRYFELLCKLPALSANRVQFLGHVSSDALAALYRHCKLFVTATEVEACPNIAIEAIASGCTIVSASTKPLVEIFGEAAEYYAQRDLESLANKMTTLLKDPERQAALAANASIRCADFSWEKCARQTSEMLRSACG